MGYHSFITSRCHIYSLGSDMERMCLITHNFTGGLFQNVRVLWMKDKQHPFEHDFFVQISHSFPILNRLTVSNKNQQKKKHEQKYLMVNLSHLVELDYCHGHVDYLKQFLSVSNTCLPYLNQIHVSYEHLVDVTNDFTPETTRRNSSKLKHLIIDDRYLTIVHSKDYDL